MKKLLLLFSASAMLLFSKSAEAQLADGSIAPNFTMTDLNGNSHTLYDYLDSGKTVVIDASAVWCPPCWSYHTSGKLETFYDTYGPSGTDEAMVLYIEADGSSTVDQMNGIGSGTQGNWVQNTPYPMILTGPTNGASFNNDYAITAFPTIYMICPNRIIRSVGQPTSAQLYTYMGDCPAPASVAEDPALLDYTGAKISCSTIEVKTRMQNNGTSALTAATITASENGNVLLTKNWSGNLATYELEEVSLGSITVANSTNLTVEITSTDGNSSNNSITTALEAISKETGLSATLTIVPDNYGSEITWKLRKSNGSIVSAGGPYTDGSTTAITKTFSLVDGECYIFTIYDSYGDGMGTSGTYTIVSDHATPITLVSSSQFSLEAVGGFRAAAPGVGINEAKTTDFNLTVTPNPANTNAFVKFNLQQAENIVINVFNAIGEQVYTINKGNVSAGEQSVKIDASALPAGFYFVNIVAGKNSQTSKFTISK